MCSWSVCSYILSNHSLQSCSNPFWYIILYQYQRIDPLRPNQQQWCITLQLHHQCISRQCHFLTCYFIDQYSFLISMWSCVLKLSQCVIFHEIASSILDRRKTKSHFSQLIITKSRHIAALANGSKQVKERVVDPLPLMTYGLKLSLKAWI